MARTIGTAKAGARPKPPPNAKQPERGAGPRKRPAEDGGASGQRKSPKQYKGDKPGHAPAPRPNMTRQEKKVASRERKAQRNRNFNLIQEVVLLWEQLRRHDLPAAKRAALVAAVMAKVQGRVAELAGSHASSRVIQACVKHGTAEDRKKILAEVSPKLVELSKSPYGHFVVSKLVTTAGKEDLAAIYKALRGRVPELLRHPAGCHVVDDLWHAVTPAQRNALAAEFYGREYALFEGGTLNNTEGPPVSLGALLAAVPPAKARGVVTHLAAAVAPLLSKGLLDAALAHRLVAEYIECAPASLVADAAEALSSTGQALLHMVHTRHGARAACAALAYGTPRDRKRAVRQFKGHALASACDEWGHLPLVTALSVTDDTELLRKSLLGELQKSLGDVVTHKYARRVLLVLLAPGSHRYLPPELEAIVAPPPKVLEAAAAAAAATAIRDDEDAEDEEAGENEMGGEGDGAQEEPEGSGDDDEEEEAQEEGQEEEQLASEGEGQEGEAEPAGPPPGPLGASKKDPALRRRELLAGGLGAALCALCSEQADQLLRCQTGADVVAEVCAGGADGVLDEAAGREAVDAVHAAVVTLAAAPRPAGAAKRKKARQQEEGEAGEGEGEAGHLLEDYWASRALRRLLLTPGAAAGRFADALWAAALRGRCRQWVGTHADKALAALLHCGSAAVREEAAAELAPLLEGESPESWARRFVQRPGGKPE